MVADLEAIYRGWDHLKIIELELKLSFKNYYFADSTSGMTEIEALYPFFQIKPT